MVGMCNPFTMLSTWASNGAWGFFSTLPCPVVGVAIENIYDNVYPSTEIIGVAATLMIQASATMPHFNTYMTSSTIGALYIQGEYTSLLFRVDQHAISTVR
jgi:hypothetical protein